jgi:hypothetical protein
MNTNAERKATITVAILIPSDLLKTALLLVSGPWLPFVVMDGSYSIV